MKAAVFTKYGPPKDVLKVKEVEKPAPKDNELLIKINAAALCWADRAIITGKPFIARLSSGLLKPKHTIPGIEIAGQVEKVGRNTTQFHSGDQIFADISECGFGAFAEYVSVPENALALKPVNIKSKNVSQLSHKPNVKDLLFIKELIEAGKVLPVIDRTYPLNEIAEALQYYGEGHPSGKIVIKMDHNLRGEV